MCRWLGQLPLLAPHPLACLCPLTTPADSCRAEPGPLHAEQLKRQCWEKVLSAAGIDWGHYDL